MTKNTNNPVSAASESIKEWKEIAEYDIPEYLVEDVFYMLMSVYTKAETALLEELIGEDDIEWDLLDISASAAMIYNNAKKNTIARLKGRLEANTNQS